MHVPVVARCYVQKKVFAVSIVLMETSIAHRNRGSWVDEDGEGPCVAEALLSMLFRRTIHET